MAAKDSISETVRNHKKRARWTEKEVLQALSELGVKLDQEYAGSIRDKHWVVFSDGSKRCVLLSNLFNGSTSGTPARYTTKSINEKLEIFGAKLLEEYKGNTDRKHWISFNTGLIKNVDLHSVLRGDSTGLNMKRHTTESVNRKLSKLGSALAEEYKGILEKKHKIQFGCGHIHETLIMSALRTSTCPACSKHGYNPGKPAYLYLLEVPFQDNILYKIGITSNTVKKRYASEGVDYKIIRLFYNQNGQCVFDAERNILENFSNIKYYGVSPFRNISITEILTQNIANDPKFLSIVNFHNLIKVEESILVSNSKDQRSSEAA